MEILIQLSACLVGGLLMSRLAKLLNLPAVTAYLVAGLLMGPYLLGALDVTGIGFGTPEAVARLDIISQVALGFIAFTIGNEFRLEQLKSMGKQAITVGILQAVATTALVDAALVALHFLNPDLISVSSAITLGAIAAATAPAATLMVVRQYKADGPLTRLLLLVVAIDDAVGLVLFSASFGVATALESGAVSLTTVLVEPVVEIVLSLVLGAAAVGGDKHIDLKEVVLRKQHHWNGLAIRDLDISRQTFIVMVRRKGKVLIPNGELVLQEGDSIILYTQSRLREASTIEV